MEARYGQWTATTRTNSTDQKKSRQPPPGDWEFVPGTNLSDPSPEVVDGRLPPDWASFNWKDPEDIEHLKKHRRQIWNTTSGSIAMHRPPWTLG
jgi:hypothetical protein